MTPSSTAQGDVPIRRRRLRRSDGFAHRFQDPAEIAVRRDDRRRVILKRGARHAESALEEIEILRLR